MNLHTRRAAWMSWVITASLVASALGQTTQPAAAGRMIQGKIKGTNVNVRSGADTNYYVVTKLNRGDTVTIVHESFNWVEILPPKGCFSVIDKNYVEKADDGSGTLNGDAWVYAGSEIDERRYAKQVQLKKGEKVQILGETADGKCYKIAPPLGATVWVHGDFVDRPGATGGDQPATGERIPPGTLSLAQAGVTTSRPAKEPALTPVAKGSEPAFGENIVKTTGLEPIKPELLTTKNDEHRAAIAKIEAGIDAESAKPAKQRNFEQFIKDLEPLASQSDDEVAKLYAETRIKQIRSLAEASRAIEEMRRLKNEAEEKADAERVRLEELRRKRIEEFPTDWVDVRGEIRLSGLFDGTGGRSKRWRVVEPGVTPAKTLAYIEVPEGSSINPSDYLDKYVEIKAEARKLSSAAMPVPVYTVRQIKLAERPARGKPPAGVMTRPAGPVTTK
ncbi:MAG TPA: SH3 domain-containing protein [Phycisphaerae bacterium]|nr:SH3 domain-containing protein [Phycisphaerae bacterium]HRR85660.1 SH3 domain-containing protein [Phycisphaerae bacterium]